MQHQHTNSFSSRQPDIKTREVRIDFSFRREVFFIIAGALVGLAMTIPSGQGTSQGSDQGQSQSP